MESSYLNARALVLLGLRGGPACGIELIERLARVTDGIPPAQGSIYPMLKRLEGQRLVRRLRPSTERRRGRARVDYELTITGVRSADAIHRSLQRLLCLGRPEASESREDESLRRERLLTSFELSSFASDLQGALPRAQGGRR
jgi:DNA-binding PadR family transcriptional regulator